jgi:hypothetical protein
MNSGTTIAIILLVIGLLVLIGIGLYFAFRSTTPASCDTFTTQSKCPDRCTWKGDSCITPCRTYTTQSKCPDRCSWKDDSCVTSKPPPTPMKPVLPIIPGPKPSPPSYCGMKCKTSTDCPGGCDQCLKGICTTNNSVSCEDYSCLTGYKLRKDGLCPTGPQSCNQSDCCQKITPPSPSPKPPPPLPPHPPGVYVHPKGSLTDKQLEQVYQQIYSLNKKQSETCGTNPLSNCSSKNPIKVDGVGTLTSSDYTQFCQYDLEKGQEGGTQICKKSCEYCSN